ncbi:hypothetical protein QO239_09680 [Cupriavidus taiwanensis]|uniref:recombination directionality factor n=1 Tax=Cupriavidus TaxID=106589 RepID=UPI000446DB19|nr:MULTISPECIES: hypothetical protein [Cupriavidus]KDP85590.1 hypothetical protein CF70_012870 [Cupriavidus sp. SK-3]MDK3022860.1 hypothetical protein [Cupriavidus taiwanensis]
MHAPITYSGFDGPRSLLEERPMRPPLIGKIRPGIKVLTRKARENPEAVRIHDAMLAQGHSFESIGIQIERETQLRNALVPKNVPWFTCRGSDFANPAVADDILQRYGEDRGDGNGLKLWRFPVVFAFDDWLRNMPNELVTYTASGRQFFSEYGPDGLRYCKTYALVQRDARANRAKRVWGGRPVVLRQDEAIPDGRCDPHSCPQYQQGFCNLSASFLFAVPSTRGLGLIELPTTSIYVLQKAHAAMQTVALARGRLVGVQFFVSKQEVEISRIDPESGKPVRQMQWLITLDADLDLAGLLDGSDRPELSHVEAAQHAIAALEGTPDTSQQRESSGDLLQEEGRTFPDVQAQHVAEEDLAAEFNELAGRLGFGNEQDRMDLRVFLQNSFGAGWTKRPEAVRQVVNDMRNALANNPVAYREQVKAIAAEISP